MILPVRASRFGGRARLIAAQQSRQALPYEIEHARGASEEYLAELCSLGAATAALEQPDAKPAFE